MYKNLGDAITDAMQKHNIEDRYWMASRGVLGFPREYILALADARMQVRDGKKLGYLAGERMAERGQAAYELADAAIIRDCPQLLADLHSTAQAVYAAFLRGEIPKMRIEDLDSWQFTLANAQREVWKSGRTRRHAA